MSNPLQQTIEALAKEKGIEPDVVISAIEEAVATASRKYYKTGENLKTRFNTETGQVDLFALEDGRRGRRPTPATEISLTKRARCTGRSTATKSPTASSWRRDGVPEADRSARPHRRADRQAGDLPEGARGRAREHLRRVQPAHRRSRQRHGQALRERRHHRRDRPHRGGAAAQGTVARRKLRAGRSRPHGHQGRQPQRQGAADRAVAHRSGAADQAVRAGSAGDLRRHGDDPRRGARGGRPRQGRGVLARARRRSGRRLRRHEGHARAVDHPRAARREDRHRRVVRGSDRRSSPTRSARRRCSASRSSTTASA